MITDVEEEEIIFSQPTNNLNIILPVNIFFDADNPQIDEPLLFSWKVIASDNSQACQDIDGNPADCSVSSADIFEFTLLYEGTSSIGDENIPDYYELSESYPNPFNPITNIDYALPESGFITLAVYNINGKLIKVLDSGNKLAGYHTVAWNATYVPSGTYFIRFTSQKYNATRKVSFVK